MLLAHFWYSCGGQEREDYEDILNKRFQRDQMWLRKMEMMEPDSLKLTNKGRDYVNGMINLFDNHPIDNANYWNRRVAVGVEKGFISEEQVSEIRATFAMNLEEAFATRLQNLSSHPITAKKKPSGEIAVGEIVETHLQDGVNEEEEPPQEESKNVLIPVTEEEIEEVSEMINSTSEETE